MICLQDSDTDSTLSFAPSEIYESPILTPDSLSMWDLTMDSEVSKFDLLEHMKRTIKHMKQKGKELSTFQYKFGISGFQCFIFVYLLVNVCA